MPLEIIMPRPCSLLLLALIACDPDGEADPGDSGGAAAEVTEEGEEAGSGREAPPYSLGACEALVDGRNTFPTGDTAYEVEVVLPADPTGAPVLFAWHWLGGNASQAVRYMELDGLAEQEGVIIIAPDSDGSAYEWHFTDPPAGNPDLLLFEDLLSCAAAQWDVDLDRIYATGMSAGGLWSSYLTMHEAEWLAATAPLSGGSDQWSYSAPGAPIPVMLTWGGESDLYATYSFHDASLYLSEALQADGHFVVECEHSTGHNLPPWGIGYVWSFLSAHPKDVSPEPWADGLPGDMPDGCRIP